MSKNSTGCLRSASGIFPHEDVAENLKGRPGGRPLSLLPPVEVFGLEGELQDQLHASGMAAEILRCIVELRTAARSHEGRSA